MQSKGKKPSRKARSPKPPVFISYSMANPSIATKIDADLRKAGFDTFLAHRDIRTNAWKNRMAIELQRPDVILLAVVTPGFFGKNWPEDISEAGTEFETMAIQDKDGRKGRICVIRVDDAFVPNHYLRYNYLDVSKTNIRRKFPAIRSLLRECLAAQKNQQPAHRPAIPSSPKKARGALAEEYKSFLRSEYQRVLERFKTPGAKEFEGARSVKYIYGWQAVQHLEEWLRPRPAILYYLVRGVIRKRHGRIDERLADAAHDIVTLKYYLFCMAVQCAQRPAQINRAIEAFVEGLGGHSTSPSEENAAKYTRAIEGLLDEIKAQHYRIEPSQVVEFASQLAGLAVAMGVQFTSVWEEDNSESRRKESRTTSSKSDESNKVTHVAEIYFSDRTNSYYEILSALQHVKWNLIRTISETLVPNELSMVTMWVRYTELNLGEAVARALGKGPLGEMVLDTHARAEVVE